VRPAVIGRIGATIAAVVVVETVVCGLAAAPLVAAWWWGLRWALRTNGLLGVAAVAAALVPTYALFALSVIPWSALATRVTGAHTPDAAEMRIDDFDWPLLTWARYMVATHLVRVLAGTLFRGSPIWTWHLRLNGARVGRRVWVNTTFISDHNLLDLGDDVVIGADVHISGHTVERGMLKTGRVRLGRGAMIGLASLVDIDTVVGDRCQVGALSVVPKHSRLDADATYTGIPATRVREHGGTPP